MQFFLNYQEVMGLNHNSSVFKSQPIILVVWSAFRSYAIDFIYNILNITKLAKKTSLNRVGQKKFNYLY